MQWALGCGVPRLHGKLRCAVFMLQFPEACAEVAAALAAIRDAAAQVRGHTCHPYRIVTSHPINLNLTSHQLERNIPST